LEETRKALRDIIAEALKAEAFTDVAVLARAAESLATVSKELAPSSATDHPSRSSLPASIEARESTAMNQMPRPEPVAPPTTARPQTYPQYLRDGERLVKRAWSKKERQPYEHKAPREAVTVLLAAIRKVKGEQRPFEAADIMPLSRENGEEYPSYQSYLALGWLRQVGAIAKGRAGYLLKKGWNDERVAQEWDALQSAA
jgi:hypothetical protein